MKPIRNKNHMARVAELPCAACGVLPVQVHHIRKAPLTGAGQKASDWYTMPLCHDCHRWVHRDREGFEAIHGTQEHLITETLDRLYGGK